ncbi:MAG TPA: hypothetical protein VGX50_05920, partial [Longimicrobium sp.]|nr:hypothetical protein [Longimicrobium sp.]
MDRALNVAPRRGLPEHTVAARSPDYVHRSEQSFPGLSFRPSVFVANTALARVPRDQFYLFGGFLRSAWTRESWSDVNVAFRSEAARAQVVPHLEPG